MILSWRTSFVRRPSNRIAVLDAAMAVMSRENEQDGESLGRLKTYFFGQQNKWQEAAKALKMVLEQDPSDHWDWYQLGPLLRETDLVAYFSHCVETRNRFADPEDWQPYGRALQVCLLHPDTVDDWKKLVEQAKDCYERSPDSQKPSRSAMVGMAQYRAGEYRDAVNTLEWAKTSEGNAIPRIKCCWFSHLPRQSWASTRMPLSVCKPRKS